MTYFDTIREIIALPGLTAGARLILIYLFDKQGKNGHSWPSIETICRDCRLSRPTVVQAIKKLADSGNLTISHPKHPSIGNTNKYSVSLTGKESLPVKKLNQLRNDTSTGKESLPELVKNLNPNDSLTNHKRPTGENKFFSLVKNKQEKPADPEIVARVLADLGLGPAI
jgi:hypothetical protein